MLISWRVPFTPLRLSETRRDPITRKNLVEEGKEAKCITVVSVLFFSGEEVWGPMEDWGNLFPLYSPEKRSLEISH